jgi:hypothetical protein
MLTPMLPTVVSCWLDVHHWVVDHSWYTWESVEREKPSLIALLSTLKTVRLAPTTIPRSKAFIYFVLPIHPLNGTHSQSMSQFSQSLKILIFKSFIYTYWSGEVTSIRDHSFHLDSLGQSTKYHGKRFCTLSVYCNLILGHDCTFFKYSTFNYLWCICFSLTGRLFYWFHCAEKAKSSAPDIFKSILH